MFTSTRRPRGLSPEGGTLVKMKNSSATPSVKGMAVRITGPGAVGPTVIGVPDCIGIWYSAGVAQNQEGWVVTGGPADVLFIGPTTAGHLARTFITAEGGYETGKALSEAVPSSPFASDKHFCEIGHVLQTRADAGLARVMLHFN